VNNNAPVTGQQFNNFAPNQGIQGNIYGAPRPAPLATFSSTPLMPQTEGTTSERSFYDHMTRLEGRYNTIAGLEIVTAVAKDFPGPTFRLVCSSKCTPTIAFSESGNGNL
jgi:hypothetical protein